MFWIHIDDSNESKPLLQPLAYASENLPKSVWAKRMEHIEHGSLRVIKILGLSMNHHRRRTLSTKSLQVIACDMAQFFNILDSNNLLNIVNCRTTKHPSLAAPQIDDHIRSRKDEPIENLKDSPERGCPVINVFFAGPIAGSKAEQPTS